MGREFSMMEVLKVPVEREEEDEFELSLELSIGGSYGKSDNLKKIEGKTRDPSEENDKGENSSNHGVSRSDFFGGKKDVGAENGCEFVDLQKRREIQALRRQEARLKREEKLKKSRGLNGGGLVEDKLILEAQQFQARVRDRETREKDGNSEDSARKKEKNDTNEVVEDLNVSFFTENRTPGTDIKSQQMQMKLQCLFPQVQYLSIGNGFEYPCVVPSWGPNVVEGQKNEENVVRPVARRNGNWNESRNSKMDCDSGNEPRNWAALSNGSLERSSSAVSNYQSTSQKGGSSSDSGSHSSSLGTHQNQCASRSDKVEHLEVNESSSLTEPDQCFGRVIPQQCMKLVSSSTSNTTEKSKEDAHSNQSNNTCSTAEDPSSPSSKETSGLINKPPKPPHHNHDGASVQHMPCVSTTGNGPIGKTITGFLYKYTKTEVSIMCVCHGSSFSPAEFVEHAGGIDILHPLRHITIVPSGLE
ncbi:hypothetical protein Pfo_007498 [Paulownia fortunei]|nr:hypothetical protein Pfo_007498 [Paulownia fortunei]